LIQARVIARRCFIRAPEAVEETGLDLECEMYEKGGRFSPDHFRWQFSHRQVSHDRRRQVVM